MVKKHVTRRDFLGATAKVTGGISVLSGTELTRTAPAPRAKVRWGIIGIGGRAKSHISVLNEIDAFEITALCDVDRAHLENGLTQVQGRQPQTYLEYSRLLEQSDVDAVAIVTPNQFHKEMTISALKAGKHVLCEKPMGITMEDCDEVVTVAKSSDAQLQYGMQLRHTPTYIKVNELVQGGAIGNIRYAWVSDFRPDIRELYKDRVKERTKNWRYFQETSGGMLLEYSIHRLDLINWWMNSKPRAISAFGGHNVWMDRETIDHAGILIEYGNGAKATYGMSLYSLGYRAPWLLIGDEGQMMVTGRSVTIQKGDVSNSLDSPRFESTEKAIDLPGGDGTKIQYEHFLKAIRGEARAYPDWRIAYDAMRVGVQGEIAIQDRKVLKL